MAASCCLIVWLSLAASQPAPLFGEEEEDELFQDAPSTERPHTDSEPPTLETMAPVPLHDDEPAKPALQLFGEDEEEEVVKSKPPPEDLFDDDKEDEPPAAAAAKPVESMVMEEDDQDDDEGDEEEYDQFEMSITVSNPEKTGIVAAAACPDC